MSPPVSEKVFETGAGRRRPFLEVLLVFLRLGVTSFGGPVAHLGYFRAEFVERRKWLDETAYVDIVALCQFLPGPASSQVGITLGTLPPAGRDVDDPHPASTSRTVVANTRKPRSGGYAGVSETDDQRDWGDV